LPAIVRPELSDSGRWGFIGKQGRDTLSLDPCGSFELGGKNCHPHVPDRKFTAFGLDMVQVRHVGPVISAMDYDRVRNRPGGQTGGINGGQEALFCE